MDTSFILHLRKMMFMNHVDMFSYFPTRIGLYLLNVSCFTSGTKHDGI